MAELEQSLEELKVVKQAFKDNINANDVSTANVEFRNMPALLKQMEKKLPAQTKNVNPTTSEQTITADSGYKLTQVNVKAVKPSDYYKPEQILSVTPKTTSQTLTPSGNSVYNQVNVSAVTSAIDSNITPTNIRKGTTILGVQGNLEADKPDQQKTVNPTTSQQFVVADNGYELAKVTVNAVTSSIDSNIQAGNIKKGTTILGVTGTLESTGTATVTLQEKSVNPTTSRQSVTPDSGYDGLSKVNVEAVVPSQYYKPEEVANVTPMTTTQVVTPSSGAVFSSVNVKAVNPADYYKPEVALNVSPSDSVQNFVASNNQVYNSVSVSAIPSDYVGNAVQRLGANTYVPSTTDAVINSGQYLNGTQTIKGDANLVADNIKEGVSLFGVVGTHKGGAVGDDSKFVQLINGTLESVTEEDLKDITSIRDGVFSDLSITNVEIPSNVTTIGDGAFANNQISELSLGDGVVTIGDSAFANNQISTLTIPQNVTTIGDSAFATNPLTEIAMESEIPPQIGETTFPSTVESIYVKYRAYDSYYAKWTINLFNNKMESGDIAHGTGIDQSSSERVRTIGYIPVEPNTTYVFTRSSSTGAIGVRNYTSSKTFIESFSPMASGVSSAEFTTGANTYYIRFIQETTDTNVKYEIYSKSGGIKDKLVRLPAIPSSITVIVNNYLNELMQGVTVTIEGNEQTFTGTTNENGVFTQGDLQPATYTVSVDDVDGFKKPSAVEIVVEENTQNSTTFTYLEKPLSMTYGVSWVNDSSTTMVRTDDSVGMTYSITGGKVKSDFDKVFPYNQMKRQVIDGNTFVYVPEMWFRVGVDSSQKITSVAVSEIKGEGDNWYKTRPFYYGAYGASSDGKVLKSVSGKYRLYSITRAVARQRAMAVGTGYHQRDLYAHAILMFLWWIEFANKNSGDIMGGSAFGKNTGGTDSFYNEEYSDNFCVSGYNTSNSQMVWHGIEDFIGNGYEYEDGITGDGTKGGNQYVSDDYTLYDDYSNGSKMSALSFNCPTTSGTVLEAVGWDKTKPFLVQPISTRQSNSDNDYFKGFCDEASNNNMVMAYTGNKTPSFPYGGVSMFGRGSVGDTDSSRGCRLMKRI